MKTRPCNIQFFFLKLLKMEKNNQYKTFAIFLICSKHGLWVNVRNASPRRF